MLGVFGYPFWLLPVMVNMVFSFVVMKRFFIFSETFANIVSPPDFRDLVNILTISPSPELFICFSSDKSRIKLFFF